jgi:hypothetical protein
MYLHRVGDKVPPISKGAEDEQRRQVEPVVRVVQFRAPLKNLSDCDAAPYLRFFLVRNEEVGGSNPLPSTIFQKGPRACIVGATASFREGEDSVCPVATANRCARNLSRRWLERCPVIG